MIKIISSLFVIASVFLITQASASTGSVQKIDYLEGQATAPNFITNASAQKVVGTFRAFSDGGTTIPVSLTGGTPNTTCTRSTASPIRGDASFLMTVTAGASRQGEGCAFDPISIATAYRGQQAIFSFPFSITGSIVAGDVIPYCYDITNSVLVGPTFVANPLLGTSGQMLATFQIPSNTSSLRCALYIARTSTGALSIKANDVKFYPAQAVTGMAGSDEVSYTPTFGGIGTPTNVNFVHRRVGDNECIHGSANAGTVAASAFTIGLPNSEAIDSLKVTGAGLQRKGAFSRSVAATVTDSLLAGGGNSYFNVGIQSGSFADAAAKNGSDVLTAGEYFTVDGCVPISGFSSNVTMGQSSTFKISSYLANGTRVSGRQPQALGEWRAQYRATGGSAALTDTAPAILPSASGGMAIYYAATWGTADASTAPSRYDIFVGKNKNVKVNFGLSSGPSGFIDATPEAQGTTSMGYVKNYDPSTGVLTIVKYVLTGSTLSAGVDATGANSVTTSPIYFDVTVSENALAVGVQAPRSEVLCTSPSGYGSTNTDVRYFTACTTSGTDLTAATDSVNGTAVTVNADGLYAITYDGDVKSASAFFPAITANSTHLTTITLPTTEIVANTETSGAGGWGNIPVTLNLKAGQVIRAQTVAAQLADGTGTTVHLRVAKVSN